MSSAISLFKNQCKRELLIQVRQIRFLVNSCPFFAYLLVYVSFNPEA